MNAMTIQNVMGPALQNALPAGLGQGSDAFAALLAQMMGGSPQGWGQGGLDQLQLLGLPGGVGNTKEEEERGTQLAADMFANLFAGDALMNPMSLPENLEGALSSLSMTQGQLTPELLMAVQEALQMVNPQETDRNGPKNQSPFPQLLQQGMGKAGKEFPVEQGATSLGKGGEPMVSALDGAAQFGSSIRKAQKLLNTQAGQEEKPKEKTLDLEALQSQVDAARLHPPTADRLHKPMEAQLDRTDLAQQLKSNIKANLGKGNSEFTVKLKPEGLGEITVKMVETQSKVSLSIETSSTQTARILSNEIDALKDALRPYQVEVREVTVSDTANSAHSNQSDLFGQFFGGQQQGQQYQSGRAPTVYYHGEPADSPKEEEPQELLAAGVDTYV